MEGTHSINRTAGPRICAWRERARSLLTITEVAAYCGVREEEVLHWIQARALPARRTEAHLYSVAFVDLWAFLERWSLLGGARSLRSRVVLADEALPC